MSDEGDVRMTVFRGDESLRVVVRSTPDGRSYVALAKYSAAGAQVLAIGIRPDEIDRIVEGLRAARNVTLGHPRHEPAVNAIEELKKLAGGAR